MKIRKKITLWISGTALLSTIIFSFFIFSELMEEPFKLIDKEMRYMTQSLVKQMESPTINGRYDLSHMPYNPDQYWIKVMDHNKKVLYKSKITYYTDIPPSNDKAIYMVEKIIPRSQIRLGQDDKDEVLFRVLVTEIQIDGLPIVVRIAKPIENLEKELDTTRRMGHLVRNLLDLSRLEQQETLTTKPVDMTILLHRVLDDYKELFAAKKINLQTDIAKELILHGDSEKLFRLLTNLIDNSIRYNFEENGQINIVAKKTSKGVLIEISNTALKIPEDELGLIFEQFYRVEKSRALTRGGGGSGLGLSIAKKIVELHDGTIEISNEPHNFIKASVFFPSALSHF